ncbi:MAG: hypothetical protein NTZ61_04385, partial [Proteobacteria bacterium]|nr:hypothetical protein [Pseudomonadota bacterium]
MRIAAARVSRFRLPLVAALTTAHGVIVERDGVLIEVETQGGLRGAGEAMPLPGFGLESIEATDAAAHAIARALLGCDARDLEGSLACARTAAAGAPAAIAAADCALHDLVARGRGVSVAALLSGERAPRSPVRSGALVADREPAAAAARARALVAHGYDTLKLKLGVDLDCDLAR